MNGFDLDMKRYPTPRSPCKNSRAVQHKPAITQAFINEIKKGHILRLFDDSPMDDLIYSLLNIFQKGDTDKYRLIHDLAYPYNSE